MAESGPAPNAVVVRPRCSIDLKSAGVSSDRLFNILCPIPSDAIALSSSQIVLDDSPIFWKILVGINLKSTGLGGDRLLNIAFLILSARFPRMRSR
ncbi:MAG: hypothetical protein F6K30_18205 [Cyanothece sp. SIO2G6]|nr:hypothetical protein [Cyanothece sp. SIO2G6]